MSDSQQSSNTFSPAILLGQPITAMRPMTPDELTRFNWTALQIGQIPLTIVLNNSIHLIAANNAQAEAPGAFQLAQSSMNTVPLRAHDPGILNSSIHSIRLMTNQERHWQLWAQPRPDLHPFVLDLSSGHRLCASTFNVYHTPTQLGDIFACFPNDDRLRITA